ncbi:glycosyltransferase family 2 protein [Paenibacillus sp. GCM10027627]|uniref:glycosyltransferase family 2 protein n=1 Tax=unclassified Paenibacillus TaxID=185978 RepID=UPI00362CB3A3
MREASKLGWKPKVSVIIPVYNAEAHLRECVESLLAQSLRECEFIFVNDGSSDSSASILERYRSSDERIILIHQTNAGVSEARNAGLLSASGTYIGFVDADDWVSPHMYETLYEAAVGHSCDAVFSNYIQGDEQSGTVMRLPIPDGAKLDQTFIRHTLLPLYLESDQYNSVCNKLYRRELASRCGVAFPKKVALGEDGLFNMKFLGVSESALYLDYAGYHYRETAGSATRNAAVDYFARTVEVYQAELPREAVQSLSGEQLLLLRTNKFVRSAMSVIHSYYSEETPLSFAKKYKYVKSMLGHSELKTALSRYIRQNGSGMGRYERLFIRMMSLESALGLYGAAAYSRARNKS